MQFRARSLLAENHQRCLESAFFIPVNSAARAAMNVPVVTADRKRSSIMRLYFWKTAGILSACGCFSATVCFGQSIAIGVIGGGRGTDDFTGSGGARGSKHYVVGPALDIGLPLGFGVEVDALYRREGFQSTFSNPFYSASSEERANS